MTLVTFTHQNGEKVMIDGIEVEWHTDINHATLGQRSITPLWEIMLLSNSPWRIFSAWCSDLRYGEGFEVLFALMLVVLTPITLPLVWLLGQFVTYRAHKKYMLIYPALKAKYLEGESLARIEV